MQDDDINILFIGDIIGKPGRLAVKSLIGGLTEKYKPELIIANGENAAHGMGITPDIAGFLFDLDIDVITTGNHIWDQKTIIPYINTQHR
ncbi:MAG: YmdB family metallophosphoesterase, partial [Deltaproteobacteria bacterium]|nr:YmdB family metallophosphoesterase [Deltaproteobacteria bacterium]